MAKTLEAHDKLIREIFEGSYQFEIPDYQRPYAWTTEQATELFDDQAEKPRCLVRRQGDVECFFGNYSRNASQRSVNEILAVGEI